MMKIMELSLSPELQRFVDEKVRSGRYGSSQEVVLAALAVLMQHDGLEAYSTSELEVMYPGLRGKIAEGLQDLREGRVTDGEAFFDELDREDDAAGGTERKTA